jgi:hypothetical protein
MSRLAAVSALFCTAILTAPTVARAQVHLQLLGGATSAAETQPFLGAGIGARIGFIEIDVEGGRFRDVVPKGVIEALNDLQRERGLPVQAIASVPATYALAAVRVIPGAGGVRPFISGGAGLARLRPRLDIVIEGISLGDVFGLTSFGSYTVPLATAGAGLRVEIGALHLEGGYRHVVIFSDFRPADLAVSGVLTRLNGAYGAIGVRF